jgi:hypothetical protein
MVCCFIYHVVVVYDTQLCASADATVFLFTVHEKWPPHAKPDPLSLLARHKLWTSSLLSTAYSVGEAKCVVDLAEPITKECPRLPFGFWHRFSGVPLLHAWSCMIHVRLFLALEFLGLHVTKLCQCICNTCLRHQCNRNREKGKTCCGRNFTNALYSIRSTILVVSDNILKLKRTTERCPDDFIFETEGVLL